MQHHSSFHHPFVMLVSVSLAIFFAAVALAHGRSEADDPLPPEKDTFIQKQVDFIAGLYDPPGPPDPNKSVVPDTSSAQLGSAVPGTPAGAGTIIQTGFAPLPGSIYTIENRWVEVKDNAYTTVYAGSLTREPEQGIVVVAIQSLDFSQVQSDIYYTPAKQGGLRVVGATGGILSLSAKDGTLWDFAPTDGTFAEPGSVASTFGVPPNWLSSPNAR